MDKVLCHTSCICSDVDYLIMHRNQVSRLAVVALMSSWVLICGGYFLGKHYTMSIIKNAHEESLFDRFESMQH